MSWFGPRHPVLRSLSATLPGRLQRPDLLRDNFWVLDMEMDQLDARTGHILSVAAYRLEGGGIDLERSIHLNLLQQQMHQQAVHIHGIRPVDALNGVSEQEMLEKLIEGGQNAWWVGHQPSLDAAFLAAAFKRHYGETYTIRFIDTLQLALAADGYRFSREGVKPTDYSLEALCKRFRLPHPDPHTAAGDAYATALLLIRLMKG